MTRGFATECPKCLTRRVLRECLPAGVPLSFSEVVSAEYIRKGRAAEVEATVTMFDGEAATVRLRVAGSLLDDPIWSHRWVVMPGGSISYEDGRWQRVGAEGLGGNLTEEFI